MAGLSIKRIWLIILLSYLVAAFAQASNRGLDLFAALPSIRSVVLSPDASLIAMLREYEGQSYLLVIERNTGKRVGEVNVAQFKAKRLSFLSNNTVAIHASRTYAVSLPLHNFEQGSAWVYDIKDNKLRRLAQRKGRLHTSVFNEGVVLGYNAAQQKVYMPAYSEQRFNLYQVGFTNTQAWRIKVGNEDTLDWLVDGKGEVLARVDYEAKKGQQTIVSYIDKKPVEIFSAQVPSPIYSVKAVRKLTRELVVQNTEDKSVFLLSLDKVKPAELELFQSELVVDQFIVDINRQLIAVVYAGLNRQYRFEDKKINSLFKRLQASKPAVKFDYVSATPDLSKIVLNASGAGLSPTFHLFDTSNEQLQPLWSAYENLNNAEVADVRAFRFKARDGVKLSALLTVPAGVKDLRQQHRPLLLMPNREKDADAYIGFNWMAQYFASRGYVVLQLNPRRQSGNEGQALSKNEQHKLAVSDYHDGFLHLVNKGIADQTRACVIGVAYAGFEALSMLSAKPNAFRCVVAINAVSDIDKYIMHKDRLRRLSRTKPIPYVRFEDQFWRGLESVSPITAVAQVDSPVLLLHGNADAVVPLSQSSAMHTALQRAGKHSQFHVLKGEDHYLSYSNTRREMLKIMDAFLAKHNPVDTKPTK